MGVADAGGNLFAKERVGDPNVVPGVGAYRPLLASAAE